jgi:predicted dehydrogenase
MKPRNSTLNVALIGYGFAGKTLHAPLIRSVPGLTLSTVVSSKPVKVKQDLPDVSVVAAADEAFSDPAVQLVVIATPNDTHFDLARRALAAGKYVVVDKPWTITVAEALELSKLAETAGRLVSVFHCRRWDADFRTIRHIIASGELGDIVHFESHYDRYRPTVLPRWREMPGPGNGIWYDLGSHLVDQVLQLFGMPEAVYADLAVQRTNAAAVDYFHVLLRYARTRVVLHGSNLVTAPRPRFEVHGTAGSFVKYGMDTQEPALRRGELPGTPGWGEDPQDGTLTTWVGEGPQVRTVRTIPGDYREYYQAILNAVRDDAPNPVTPGEALEVMRVLEAACRSSELRAEVPLGL